MSSTNGTDHGNDTFDLYGDSSPTPLILIIMGGFLCLTFLIVFMTKVQTRYAQAGRQGLWGMRPWPRMSSRSNRQNDGDVELAPLHHARSTASPSPMPPRPDGPTPERMRRPDPIANASLPSRAARDESPNRPYGEQWLQAHPDVDISFAFRSSVAASRLPRALPPTPTPAARNAGPSGNAVASDGTPPPKYEA